MTLMTYLLVNPFADRFNEGGPFIMTLILICFLACVFFIIKSTRSLKKTNGFHKSIDLLKEVSLLGLVIGVFGSLLGLVTAFDSIDAQGDVSLGIFASGLKVTLLTLIFGTFTFIIARIAVVVLKLIRKEHMQIEA